MMEDGVGGEVTGVEMRLCRRERKGGTEKVKGAPRRAKASGALGRVARWDFVWWKPSWGCERNILTELIRANDGFGFCILQHRLHLVILCDLTGRNTYHRYNDDVVDPPSCKLD